jgi:hypothetical protein
MVCHSCHKVGHRLRDCPNKVSEHPGDACQRVRSLLVTAQRAQSCFICGASDHMRSSCPARVCRLCLRFGHVSRDCRITDIPRFQFNMYCNRCGIRGHVAAVCSELWRQCHFRENDGFSGKAPRDRSWCFNCGSSSHFGFECSQLRRDVAGTIPSPFVNHFDPRVFALSAKQQQQQHQQQQQQKQQQQQQQQEQQPRRKRFVSVSITDSDEDASSEARSNPPPSKSHRRHPSAESAAIPAAPTVSLRNKSSDSNRQKGKLPEPHQSSASDMEISDDDNPLSLPSVPKDSPHSRIAPTVSPGERQNVQPGGFSRKRELDELLHGLSSRQKTPIAQRLASTPEMLPTASPLVHSARDDSGDPFSRLGPRHESRGQVDLRSAGNVEPQPAIDVLQLWKRLGEDDTPRAPANKKVTSLDQNWRALQQSSSYQGRSSPSPRGSGSSRSAPDFPRGSAPVRTSAHQQQQQQQQQQMQYHQRSSHYQDASQRSWIGDMSMRGARHAGPQYRGGYRGPWS